MPDVRLINGKKIAAGLRRDIKKDVAALYAAKGITPGLAVVLVGDDPASQVYVKAKRRAAIRAGMNSYLHILPAGTHEKTLSLLIQTLNKHPDVHGILLQLPLPPHLDASRIIAQISPQKDVDGLHPANIGNMVMGHPAFIPCTPLGCLYLIKSVRSNLQGLNATVIGASNLVGKPMAQLLLREKCTVTQAHSKTRALKDATQNADILIVATGAAGLIKAGHVKNGAIVIDVGISRLSDSSLVGDVDFADVTAYRDCYITPVPGGVGPMTIAMLLSNTLLAAKFS